MRKIMIILFTFILTLSVLFLNLCERENSITLYESYEEALEMYLQNNFMTFEVLKTINIEDSKVVLLYGNDEFFTALEIEKNKNGYRGKKIIADYDLISNPVNLIEVDILVKGKTIQFEVGKLNDISLDYDPFKDMSNINKSIDNIVFSYEILNK